MSWSGWRRLSGIDFTKLPVDAGIYRIRALRGTSPIRIRRFLKTDLAGILYVG